MASKGITITAALALLALSSCGDAAAPSKHGGGGVVGAADPEAAARAAPFRIAGAGLMMTPAEAAAALAANGYEEDRESKGSVVWNGPTFEARVRARLSGGPEDRGRLVPSLQTYSKGSERIDVHYGAFPGDQRATSIIYKNDGPSPSAQDIKAGLEKRYGKGLSPFGIDEKWCSPAPCGASSAVLSANGQGIDLYAGGGLGAVGADDRRIDAAARASGQGQKGSF